MFSGYNVNVAYYQDVSPLIHHKIVHIDSCPDLGYYLINDTDRSFGHDVCNLCFCKDTGTAVCWEREAYKCMPTYTLENTRIPRNRRGLFSRSSLFTLSKPLDSSKLVFATQNKQECQPYESRYSDDCPPDDWCIGCTVCDCSSEGRWDCHVLSFCGEKKTDDKEMLSKIPRNVLKKMYKMKVTKETVPKATQKKPSTIKPVTKQHYKKKFISTINSNKQGKISKQGKAKIHSKLGSVKKGMKASIINLSKSNTMTSKPVYAKVIRRHKLPTDLVTVKPPVSEMKTFRYKDDNSTVKYVKIMIQKIIAMMGKNLKQMYNNDTNVPIAHWKQPARDSMMTRIDNSANRSNKRELYKNLKYRSKRSEDMGDVTIELLSDVASYSVKPLSIPIIKNNITDIINITDDITTQINNYTKYENTIIDLSSKVVAINDTTTSTVSTQSLDTKNISDFTSEETKPLTIPSQGSGVDGYPMNISKVNTNITEPNLLIIVENITSTAPTITKLKSKYKPMSQKSHILTDDIYLLPSLLNELKLKMHLLKMLYGVNEILPKQKSYDINDENNNSDNTHNAYKTAGEVTGKNRKCLIIKNEKENKSDLICKILGTCKLSDEKLLLLKSKLRSLRNDAFEIMHIMSSIKGMLKNFKNTSGHQKVSRRAYRDGPVVESFGPPRTHIEIIDSMKRDIKYFLKRLETFSDQFKSVVDELDKSCLSYTVKNETYTTDKSRKTKRINRIYRKKFVKQLDRLLMKYNLPQNTFLIKVAQALDEHDRRANGTTRLVNNKHPFNKGANYITSKAYAKKLLHNMRLLKVLSEKLYPTKLREKRQISSEDSTLNYLLTLLEIVVKQNFESKDDDGIDTLIDVIKSAPDIEPMRKNAFDLTTFVNSDYITSTAASPILRVSTENLNIPIYIETRQPYSEEVLATVTQRTVYGPDDEDSTFKYITMPDTIVNFDSHTDATVSKDVFIQRTESSKIKEFYKTLFKLETNKVDEEKDAKMKPVIENIFTYTTKHPSIAMVSDINDTSNAIGESNSNKNSIISSRIGIPWAESTEELIKNANNEKPRELTVNATYEIKEVKATQDISNVSGDDRIQTDDDSSKDDNDNDDDDIMDKKQNQLLTSLDYGGGEKVEDGNQDDKVANDIFE